MRRIERTILKVVVVLTILTASSLVNMNSGLTAVTVSADDLSEIDIQVAKKVKLLQGKALLEARTVLIRRPAYRSGRLERPLTNDDLSNLVNLKNGINVTGDQGVVQFYGYLQGDSVLL